MVNIPKNYKNAVQRLWNGLCDIVIYKAVENEKNGRTEHREETVVSGLACRLSFGTKSTVNPVNGAHTAVQGVTLIIGNDVDIPEGSKLVVTQNGVTTAYCKSGKPAHYSTHQEIELELFKGWV